MFKSTRRFMVWKAINFGNCVLAALEPPATADSSALPLTDCREISRLLLFEFWTAEIGVFVIPGLREQEKVDCEEWILGLKMSDGLGCGKNKSCLKAKFKAMVAKKMSNRMEPLNNFIQKELLFICAVYYVTYIVARRCYSTYFLWF